MSARIDIKTDIWTALLEPYSITAIAQGPVRNLLFKVNETTGLDVQLWSTDMLTVNLRQSDLFVLLPAIYKLSNKYKNTVCDFMIFVLSGSLVCTYTTFDMCARCVGVLMPSRSPMRLHLAQRKMLKFQPNAPQQNPTSSIQTLMLKMLAIFSALASQGSSLPSKT